MSAEPDFVVPEGVDAVFNVIHGTFGEDGQIQRILEARGIPYTGAGSVSSELAFDKARSKARFVECRVPTADYQLLPLATARPEDVKIPVPLVMKPLREGSSVGVHIIKDASGIGGGDRRFEKVWRRGAGGAVHCREGTNGWDSR